MDPEFGEAALAIIAGDSDGLANLLSADPGLATRVSSVSHPTLLQLVACEAASLPDPVGSSRRPASATRRRSTGSSGATRRPKAPARSHRRFPTLSPIRWPTIRSRSSTTHS